MERDLNFLTMKCIYLISTHTLTWSVTKSCLSSCNWRVISTHTLTWSVTQVHCLYISKPLFQLTRSRGAWRSGAKEHTLFEKFQLTRSRGAWLAENICQFFHVVISTHTLTWSVTDMQSAKLRSISFQLTRSRGAWHDSENAANNTNNFNSHAHVERDWLFWFEM